MFTYLLRLTFEGHTVKTNVFTCPSLYTGCASTHFTRRRMESFMCVIERVFEQQYIDIHVQQWNTKRSTCVWLSLYVTFSCIICPNSFLFSFLLRMRLRKRNTGNMLLVYLTPTRKHIHNQHHKNHLCLSSYIPKLCPNHPSLSLSLSLYFSQVDNMLKDKYVAYITKTFLISWRG